MRYGFNWQIPFRTAVPGYTEYLLKYLNQMNYMACNITDLIECNEPTTRLDFGTVKGFLLNQRPLINDPIEHLANWGLLNTVIKLATTLDGTTGATNIPPGYLFIKGNYKDGSDEILFDDGNGNLITYLRVVGKIDYAAGTYTIDETKTDIKTAADFVIGYSDGVVKYPAEVTVTTPSLSGYEVTGVAINASGAGTGYTANDVVTLPDGSTVTVTTVGSAGEATAITLLDGKISSIDAKGTGIGVTGGTGTGLLIDVTTTTVNAKLFQVSGAIPGTAASPPGVSIYYTDTTHKIYIGYTTANAELLQQIYDNLRRY